MEKYKFFIKNVYVKIKESLVKEIPNKNNKFTIIDDIYNYLSFYNKKYSEKVDLQKIIQDNNEEFEIINKIINKITKYLTELFFNLDYIMKMIKLLTIIMLAILMITITKIISMNILCQNMGKRQIELMILKIQLKIMKII